VAVGVEVVAGSFTAEKPRTLFEGQFFTHVLLNYDVAPGGESFVLFQSARATGERNHLILVTHWFEELRRPFTIP
jgi:hypothetical protein